MRPLSGRTTPPSTFMSVLLPAPFSPTKPSTSPARSRSDTPSSATTPGKALPMPSSSSSGDPPAAAATPGASAAAEQVPQVGLELADIRAVDHPRVHDVLLVLRNPAPVAAQH